jgi:hypothetical protein
MSSQRASNRARCSITIRIARPVSPRVMPSVQTRSGVIIYTEQIDLGVTIAENVDVRRRVIIDENDHSQAVGT